jgi:ABC-type oligopeptide transport system substrate-binding subunit
LPLGDDAAAAQVTAGLVYQTLLDCSDGTYRPGLAESWDVSNDRMRLAVRVRSGVRWHDHRAFGVLDVQATIEPLLRAGTDAPAFRAALADVASIELVTERTVRRSNARRIRARALCDVPILPDHLIRGVRLESSPIARQPVGTGPFRFGGWEHGKRIRLERSSDAWGPPPGVDEIVFDVDGDAVRALNRTRRGDIDVLSRVLDVHYPEQVEPTTLPGAVAAAVAPVFVPAREPPALYPLSDPRFRRAIARLWDPRSSPAKLRQARPSDPGAAARGRSRRRPPIGREPWPRSRTPATATATPTASAITWASDPDDDARARRQQAVQRRGPRLRARDAEGGAARRSCPPTRRPPWPASKRGDFDLAP